MAAQVGEKQGAVLRLAHVGDETGVRTLADVCGLSLDVVRELDLPHSELWLSEQNGVPIGLGLVWFLGDEMEIIDIGVRPDQRRMGRGQTILKHLLERGRVRGAQTAFLEVRATNTAAQRLYFKHGFARHAERVRYYADGEDAWILRRCLDGEQGTGSGGCRDSA